MTYYETAQDVTISHERAIEELINHGNPITEIPFFYTELGQQKEYSAQSVLQFLGY